MEGCFKFFVAELYEKKKECLKILVDLFDTLSKPQKPSWVFSNQKKKIFPFWSIQLRIEFFISYFFSGIQCSSRIPLFQRPWTPGGLSNVRLFPRYVVIRVHVGQHDFPQRAILSRPRQLRSGKYCWLFLIFPCLTLIGLSYESKKNAHL